MKNLIQFLAVIFTALLLPFAFILVLAIITPYTYVQISTSYCETGLLPFIFFVISFIISAVCIFTAD